MKKPPKTLSAVLAVFLACSLMAEAAFAKRMGSGGNLGGRSTYSRSYTPSSPTPYAPSSPTSPTAPAQTARPTTE